jgi:hypothetical protein
LDTTSSNEPISVVVQVRNGGRSTQAVLNAAYAGILRSSVSVNPEDRLPPPRERLIAEYNGAANEEQQHEHSFAQRISGASPEYLEPRSYIEREEFNVRNHINQISQDIRLDNVAVFATASSFSGSIDRDVLNANRKNFGQFAGIFPNLRVPPPHTTTGMRPFKSKSNPPQNGTTWGLASTHAVDAWSTFATRNKGARGADSVVAVLDTGVDIDHPDLQDKIIDWAEFDINGRKVLRSLPADSLGHGTHVCGTIAGGDASGDHIGMAPEALIIVAKVIDDRAGGSLAQLLAGFDWALKCGAHVINMSLGTATFDHILASEWDMDPWETTLARAIRAGVVTVAAIGNDGHQTTCSPANHLLAFSVGAHADDSRCAAFSGGSALKVVRPVGPEGAPMSVTYNKPDISAPGINILSAMPLHGQDKPWDVKHGTSMAAPHVSGAVAQLLSATDIKNLPAPLRAPVICDLLQAACLDVGEIGVDQRFGYGCINIHAAIARARELGY